MKLTIIIMFIMLFELKLLGNLEFNPIINFILGWLIEIIHYIIIKFRKLFK